MKKLIYVLTLFIVGCFFWQPTITTHYIKDGWSIFKDDAANNVVVHKMLRYDEEKDESTIKLKFINKNDSLYVFVKYQLRIVFYEDEESKFYHKKKASVLGSTKRDGIFFVKIQPWGFAILTSTMKGIRIRKMSFYSYEATKV